MGDDEQDTRRIIALNKLMNRAFLIGFLTGFFAASMLATVIGYAIYRY